MGTLNKTSERFTNAVTKLYNAFHENRLNAFNCKHCAIGNMCNNTNTWVNNWFTDTSGGCITQKFRNMTSPVKDVKRTGYSTYELSRVELIFLKSFDISDERDGKNKEQQFKGLCAVVEYLCELEGIPNVMDYTCLFETENNEPKYKLENVL